MPHNYAKPEPLLCSSCHSQDDICEKEYLAACCYRYRRAPSSIDLCLTSSLLDVAIDITDRHGGAISQVPERGSGCYQRVYRSIRCALIILGDVDSTIADPFLRFFCLIAMVLPSRSRIGIELIYLKGVLWSGDHLFPGTVEALELLRSRGSYNGPRSLFLYLTFRRKEDRLCHQQLD